MNNDNAQPTGAIARFLNGIERVGNKLPDPAIIFLVAMITIWILSWLFSGVDFSAIDPRTGDPIVIKNLLTGDSLATSIDHGQNLYRLCASRSGVSGYVRCWCR